MQLRRYSGGPNDSGSSDSNTKFTCVCPLIMICGGQAVTCYFRHLKEVFKKAGIEVTSENKKEVDKVIHGIVGVEYKNCPAAGKEVKTRIAEDEAGFVSLLKDAWRKQK
jgi:hypothetical protein